MLFIALTLRSVCSVEVIYLQWYMIHIETDLRFHVSSICDINPGIDNMYIV